MWESLEESHMHADFTHNTSLIRSEKRLRKYSKSVISPSHYVEKPSSLYKTTTYSFSFASKKLKSYKEP